MVWHFLLVKHIPEVVFTDSTVLKDPAEYLRLFHADPPGSVIHKINPSLVGFQILPAGAGIKPALVGGFFNDFSVSSHHGLSNTGVDPGALQQGCQTGQQAFFLRLHPNWLRELQLLWRCQSLPEVSQSCPPY